mgnify:CR=1 FL=1
MPKIIDKSEEKSKMVKSLSGLGITQEQICSILGIARNTLTKYYNEELTQGKAEANAQVAKNLYRIATGEGQGAVTAGIFWLKCQAGWRDTSTLEVINADEDESRVRRIVNRLTEARLQREESDASTGRVDNEQGTSKTSHS